MKNNSTKIITILILIILTSICFSAFVFAGQAELNYANKLTEITNTLRKYGVTFVAFAAVATAIIFMTGAVNPDAKNMGKIALLGIIFGTMFLVFSDGIGKIMFTVLEKDPSQLVVNAENVDKRFGKAISIVGETGGTTTSSGGGVNNSKNPLKAIVIAIRDAIVASASEAYAKSMCTTIQVPVWIRQADGTKKSGKRWIEVNKEIAGQVSAIFEEIYNDPEQFPIKNAGGWSWRGGKLSLPNHPSGLAIDINYEENYMVKNGSIVAGKYYKPGTDPYSMPANGSVVRIFKKYGWDWGGDWRSSKDYMHFSFLGG